MKRFLKYNICFFVLRSMYRSVFLKKIFIRKEHTIQKYRYLFNCLNRWLMLKEQNIGLAGYFINNNFNKIAVYGYGILGRHFVRELTD